MKYKTSVLGYIYRFSTIIILCFISNNALLLDYLNLWSMSIFNVLVFILINIFPSVTKKGYNSLRLRICSHGNELLIYYSVTSVFSVFFNIFTGYHMISDNNWAGWIISVIICLIYETLLFLHGIISVYCTSLQLGIKYRVLTLVFCFIPVLRLIFLFTIIKIISDEINFEIGKNLLNKSRENEKVCATKYPVLLVHGVFFRDSKYFNYWGRIPKELEKNGATIYYGNHQSALAVEDSGKEIADRIKEIVNSTGCEKLNIIAHSKGGLDCRYAISKCDCEKYVASLITINTPHRGCCFADYLLNKLSENIKNNIADKYNFTLKKLGDTSPDFLSAVSCLTESYCKKFNNKIYDSSNVIYKSVGSKLNRATSGKFPLNFSYHLVKLFDGDNDGLVSENSFSWGNDYTFITTKGKRGISHGDVIDLNRENIKNFDVREFYVNILYTLKKQGL